MIVWHAVDVNRSLGSEPCDGTTSKAPGGSSTIAISSSTASTDVELSTGGTMGEIASALLPLMDDNGCAGEGVVMLMGGMGELRVASSWSRC